MFITLVMKLAHLSETVNLSGENQHTH